MDATLIARAPAPSSFLLPIRVPHSCTEVLSLLSAKKALHEDLRQPQSLEGARSDQRALPTLEAESSCVSDHHGCTRPAYRPFGKVAAETGGRDRMTDCNDGGPCRIGVASIRLGALRRSEFPLGGELPVGRAKAKDQRAQQRHRPCRIARHHLDDLVRRVSLASRRFPGDRCG